MSAKLDELINNAKITELLNKKKQEEENKSCILLMVISITMNSRTILKTMTVKTTAYMLRQLNKKPIQ